MPISRRGVLALAVGLPLIGIWGAWLAVSIVAEGGAEGNLLAWQQRFGTDDEVLARYPTRPTSETAKELEIVAAGLEIDLLPIHERGQRGPRVRRGGPAPRFDRHLLGAYLRREVERTDPGVGDPPPAVAHFLDEHATDLEAVRALLLGHELPEWARDLSGLFAAPLPNLMGHLDLQRALVSETLARAARGDPDRALDTLEAAWRLNETLRGEPILIVQVVALRITQWQLGALRRIESAGAPWERRLAETSLREPFLEALRFEGWSVAHVDRYGGPSSGVSVSERALYGIARPYFRYCFADAGSRYRGRLAELEQLGPSCAALESETALDWLRVRVPRWNRFGNAAAALDLPMFLRRLVRAELDVELTRKALELRAARDARGSWPAPSPAITRSTVCPEVGFRYEVGGDGAMTIAFGRAFAADGAEQGIELPLSYSAGAAIPTAP